MCVCVCVCVCEERSAGSGDNVMVVGIVQHSTGGSGGKVGAKA